MPDAGLRDIRCKSPRCDVPGGRVLCVISAESLTSVSRRGTVVAWFGGLPAYLKCRCGWSWRNPVLLDISDQLKLLETS